MLDLSRLKWNVLLPHRSFALGRFLLCELAREEAEAEDVEQDAELQRRVDEPRSIREISAIQNILRPTLRASGMPSPSPSYSAYASPTRAAHFAPEREELASVLSKFGRNCVKP